MHAGVDDLAEASHLRLLDWVLGQKRVLGMRLFEILADGHRFDEDFSVRRQERRNGLDSRYDTPLGLTFLYSYDFCSPLKRWTKRNSWGMALRLSTILTRQAVELLK